MLIIREQCIVRAKGGATESRLPDSKFVLTLCQPDSPKIDEAMSINSQTSDRGRGGGDSPGGRLLCPAESSPPQRGEVHMAVSGVRAGHLAMIAPYGRPLFGATDKGELPCRGNNHILRCWIAQMHRDAVQQLSCTLPRLGRETRRCAGLSLLAATAQW